MCVCVCVGGGGDWKGKVEGELKMANIFRLMKIWLDDTGALATTRRMRRAALVLQGWFY